ncbi:MAG: hypothetical protein GKR97_02710 [Rhizobiaceae bacterium]|nr:hypothetical protein [Rhizobiaceae bacterium]
MSPNISNRLSAKLAHIREGSYKPKHFIIADAKDADMGGGINGVGFIDDGRGVLKAKTAADYLTSMKQMIASELADIMLTSMASAEHLMAENAYANTDICPAIRLNDTTDIWGFRGAVYQDTPALPFRTARLQQARNLCALGLYAITFYNDRDVDVATLNAYRDFREQADEVGMLHFLEVFNPAFDINTPDADLGSYVNDAIVRCLAGVAGCEHPLFLKMQYNGARSMEELASFDPGKLIVGVLGGAAGTTRDTFELISQTERFGGRVALFGRKIYGAEDSVELVRLMRAVIEDDVSTSEAVEAYHDGLTKKGLAPMRALEQDREVTDPILKPEAS